MVDATRLDAAEDDLFAILEYGAGQWGHIEALKFVLSFRAVDDWLASHPLMGRERPELGVGVRSWLHRDYIIYYQFDGLRVEVVRILHGSVHAGTVDMSH